MIKCNSCGYENNDGSKICINCHGTIAESISKSVLESGDTERETGKKVAIVVIVAFFALVFGAMFFFGDSNKPIIDTMLLGSWESQMYGYTETWTFEDDGTYCRVGSGTGLFADNLEMNDWYYKAEDGVLKISWSENIEEYVSATYEYQFGVTETGRQCLILTEFDVNTGKKTVLLYKID